ncbi:MULTISPECIES: hypothetical protein [unclassified Rhizobium]|uniref:hypothetical protein n=1 Tax=unclassified Rhizobium TaxID=2613769 RepID=UPI002B25503D|nr:MULTISPECIES: hypothetical protein [unclassified Rhizobium]
MAAYHSKFYDVVSGIHLLNDGAGGFDLSLNGRKCREAGKADDATAQKDKEVTRDAVVILMAGYAAELIAKEKSSAITPHRPSADPDYSMAGTFLKGAGLSQKIDRAEQEARAILIENWATVERLATLAFEKKGLSWLEVSEVLDPEV